MHIFVVLTVIKGEHSRNHKNILYQRVLYILKRVWLLKENRYKYSILKKNCLEIALIVFIMHYTNSYFQA
jgi:hypothetical protein